MAGAGLADPAVRAAVFLRLTRRNRGVDVLRIVVPLIGALLLGGLIAGIVIGNLAREYGVSGVRFERDRLLIETPRYEGVTENGTRYKVVAETASALISRAEVIDLGQARLEITRPDGVSFTATAGHALYDILKQTVEVPDFADVVDSRNTVSRLHDAHVDWAAQTITARGGAEVDFADGTQLRARTLVMYGKDNRWDMTGVTLITSGPKEAQ